MRPSPTRLLALAALLLTLLPGAIAAQSTPEEHLLDLPILVAACEEDPGNRIHPGGGRFDPKAEMPRFGCEPVEGVDITVANLEIDFFDRCTTDEDGMCRIEAPTDPERELMVAVHMTTVEPGWEPAEPVTTMVHYSEFTGIAVPLFADPAATPGAGEDPEERQTIAVNVARCEDGSTAEGCDRAPVEALVLASPAEVSVEGYPWLATNEDGWVSFDRAALPGVKVDLMLQTDTEPRFACSEVASGDRIPTEWVEGREGGFIRLPSAAIDGDITCDVTLLDAPE